MKALSLIALAAVAISSLSVSAWNGRRSVAVPAGRVYGGVYNHGYGLGVRHLHGYPRHRAPRIIAPAPSYPVYPAPVDPEPIPVPAPVPVLPDPIEESAIYGYPPAYAPAYPVEPAYPVAPVAPAVALPPQVYINEPCDPYQYEIPVVNTVPMNSVYCTSAYRHECQRVYRDTRVYTYDVPTMGVCNIRPTVNGSWVLLLNNRTLLAEAATRARIEVRYRNMARMYCR